MPTSGEISDAMFKVLRLFIGRESSGLTPDEPGMKSQTAQALERRGLLYGRRAIPRFRWFLTGGGRATLGWLKK